MEIPISDLALDYLYCIEEEFKEAKQKKLSRLSIQWGKYSTGMNRATRMLIQQKHPDSFMLKMVYNIWVAYSELLELNHRYPAKHRKKKEKRKLRNAIKILKKMVKTGKIPQQFEKYWED